MQLTLNKTTDAINHKRTDVSSSLLACSFNYSGFPSNDGFHQTIETPLLSEDFCPTDLHDDLSQQPGILSFGVSTAARCLVTVAGGGKW